MLVENKGNFLSERQFCLLFIIVAIPFKIAMLPSYLSLSCEGDSIFCIMAMVLVELLVLSAVFKICRVGGLVNVYKNSSGYRYNRMDSRIKSKIDNS